MFIYKITNIVNDKIYIGQSIRSIEKRFQRHINDAINNILDTHLARAIRKYGKENFTLELIDTANNQDELNQKEQYWIRYYDSVNNGYNETDAIYKCGGNTYQYKSDDELNSIKNKISITKTGDKNPNSKSIKCLNVNTNEELIFSTVEECRKYFNEKTHRFITTRVLHQTKSLYNGEWAISYIEDEYYSFKSKVNKSGKKVQVINLETNIEMIFESIRLASRNLNISRGKINQHIKNNEIQFLIDNYQITILN